MTRPSRSLPGFLLAAMLAAPASAQDLTGTWRAENGTRYVVLQSGEEFCWYAEPTSLFCGRVLGSLIVGSWLDLPTSFSRSGRMVLRIESPNRLVKVHQTANYGVSVWTREGTVPGPVAQLPPPPPPPQLPPPTPTVTPAAGPAPIPGGSAVENGGTRGWDYRGVGEDYRDKTGSRVQFTCPPDPAPVEWRGVYGIDVYTGDSALCQAAVHAGQITFAAGGSFTIEILPGQSEYRGEPRNGVLSARFGAWSISYSFIARPGAAMADRGAPPSPAGGGAAGGDVIDGGTLDWAGVVAPELRDRPGRRIRYTCPPGGQFYGYVWGTGVYTGDTLPCAAAVHTGVITFAAGGAITVEIRAGQASYQGSDRNGVASKNFGPYTSSYVIVR